MKNAACSIPDVSGPVVSVVVRSFNRLPSLCALLEALLRQTWRDLEVVGVERARGDVFLFIDDDDLPVGDEWVTQHMRALEDPKCLGVSGKHIHNDELVHRTSRLKMVLTGTLSYDPILKISTTYVQHDYKVAPV